FDRVPALARRGPPGPAFRRPRRLRLVLGRWLGLEPLLGPGCPVGLQLAADLALECLVLARSVFSAGLFAHRHASLKLTAGHGPWPDGGQPPVLPLAAPGRHPGAGRTPPGGLWRVPAAAAPRAIRTAGGTDRAGALVAGWRLEPFGSSPARA